jgi:HPt (histidine-containing phosphotransfer) domain-containing protein
MALPNPAEVLDLSVINGLRELREAGQPDPLKELVELFLKDARPRMERMSAALKAQNGAELGALAHSLKGSASNLGARRLALLAASLEKQAKAGSVLEAASGLEAVQAEFERVECTLASEVSK